MKTLFGIIFFLLLTPVVAHSDLKIIGLFQGVAIVKIDGKQVTLREGQSSNTGIQLISANSSEALFLINGIQKKYNLSDTSNYQPVEKTKEMLILSPDQHGRYRTHGEVNDKKVTFIIDTGATHIALNSTKAKALNIDYLKGKPIKVETAAGIIPAYSVILDSVKVGDIIQKHIPALVLVGQQPKQILLGMTFLKALDIKQKGSLLYLEEK